MFNLTKSQNKLFFQNINLCLTLEICFLTSVVIFVFYKHAHLDMFLRGNNLYAWTVE